MFRPFAVPIAATSAFSLFAWCLATSFAVGNPGDDSRPENRVEPTTAKPSGEPVEKSVAERLGTLVDGDFARVAFGESVERVANDCNVGVYVDADGLKAAGYTRSMPVTASLGRVSGRVALAGIVRRYDRLTFAVDEARRRVVVTTLENVAKFTLRGHLAMEVERLRGRIGDGLANVRTYRSFRLHVARCAGTLAVLAELASADREVTWRARSGRVQQLAVRLRTAAMDPGIEGFRTARALHGELEAVLGEPPKKEVEPVAVQSMPIPFTMLRFDEFLGSMQEGLVDAETLDDRRAARARDAALVAAMADLVVRRKEAAEDTDFAEHALGLTRAARTLRWSLDAGDGPETVRANVKSVTTRCSSCHAEYR